MTLTADVAVRASAALPSMTTGTGIPTLADICFSPRNAYTNAISPTLYKLGYIRVDAGGTGYTDDAVVSVGGTEVGRIILGDAGVYGASGVIAAVRITNNLGLTLTSAPTLTFSGGTGAVLTAVLVDQEAARVAFKATLIDWSYIGCAVDSGGTTDGTEAAFITAWQGAYKMQLTNNSKPNGGGVSRTGIIAATAFGGEVINAAEPTYGAGVGYATLADATTVTNLIASFVTTAARTTSGRIMHDDPGFQNQVVNVADFGTAAIAGFPTWLAANTTAPQRTADGLDASASILGGYDYKAVLVAWYTASGLSGPSTSATHNSNRRTIQSGVNAGQATPGYNLWRKYHRSLLRSYMTSLKAALGANKLAVNHFCPWPVTPNLSVGGFFFNSAIKDGVADQADYSVTEWSTAAALATPITWAQLSAEFAIHAASVRAIGKMLTGPQVSLDPIYHNATKQKSFLRQATSLINALGCSSCPCWDSFIQLGNGKAWRAFMEASDYGGMWDFIAANPSLYSGFESMATVVLPINADQFCRTTSGVWPRNQNLMDAVSSMLAAGTPFAFSPYSNLDTSMARNQALEALACYSLSTSGQNTVLTSEVPVPDNWAAAASAAQLAAANKYWVSRVTGATGAVGSVYAIPRVNTTTKQIAIHICNLQSTAAGAGVTETGLSLQFSHFGRGINTYTATVHRPGSASQLLSVVRGPGYDSMALPSIDDRGAIVLLQMVELNYTPMGMFSFSRASA